MNSSTVGEPPKPTLGPRPRLPATLAFVAGFVDACGFLAFEGFFVAQATGSFVVAGSELVNSNDKYGLKVLAIPVFLVSGMVATFVVRLVARFDQLGLTIMLSVEAMLLTVLAATWLFRVPDELNAEIALLGLAAMGVQGATTRLLLIGYGSTNVMTTNTIQLSIDLADSILNRCLPTTLLPTTIIIGGFLVGVAAGAIVFKAIGLGGVIIPAAIVFSLVFVAREAGQP
ncbi:YoaK family protein [Mesorhizobium sp. CO1-1-8]|uniref:YoaK family protein n=1 Tax=Mesorhizobium sp. CO1-1-8 TaxID=2876631 RepID=UPI001CD136EE|nr:YoaK family protein [Mesorhizobium sp. CO1-1-8]MBZ9774055.1 DUF1275 domain-containing protein [Mesorhizobium sp. CO1-1-8]